MTDRAIYDLMIGNIRLSGQMEMQAEIDLRNELRLDTPNPAILRIMEEELAYYSKARGRATALLTEQMVRDSDIKSSRPVNGPCDGTHTHWLVIAILMSGAISVGCIGWAVTWVLG